MDGVDAESGESKEQREQRHRSLWNQLDVKRKGFLDLDSLKRGLAQMNHRAANYILITLVYG